VRVTGRFAWLAVAGALVGGSLAGCGDSNNNSGTPAGGATTSASAAGQQVTGNLTVYAAASLTESFTKLGQQFDAQHGTKTTFNFAGSSTLATQITQGAKVDVFASASPATMDTVTTAGEASNPTTFASNVLEIAVPLDNPQKIASLADLAKPGVKVALCAKDVPCGAAAVKLLAADKITVKPVTLESDVKAALSKVQLGEVDAALVYKTDVKAAAGKVTGIEIPDADKAVNKYPIVALAHASNAAAAQAFVQYVLGPDGRKALGDAGFTLP
jgi:molybdate transport system substrate-binding protein